VLVKLRGQQPQEVVLLGIHRGGKLRLARPIEKAKLYWHNFEHHRDVLVFENNASIIGPIESIIGATIVLCHCHKSVFTLVKLFHEKTNQIYGRIRSSVMV